jgi:hypothetical protein
MKQCPRCRKLFSDEMLKFCRSDGAQLVSAATFLEEAATILLSIRQITERGFRVVRQDTSSFTMKKELSRGAREK